MHATTPIGQRKTRPDGKIEFPPYASLCRPIDCEIYQAQQTKKKIDAGVSRSRASKENGFQVRRINHSATTSQNKRKKKKIENAKQALYQLS